MSKIPHCLGWSLSLSLIFPPHLTLVFSCFFSFLLAYKKGFSAIGGYRTKPDRMFQLSRHWLFTLPQGLLHQFNSAMAGKMVEALVGE